MKNNFIQSLSDQGLAGLIAHECAEYLYMDEAEHDGCSYIGRQMRIDHYAETRGFGDGMIEFFWNKIEQLDKDDGKIIICPTVEI